MQDQATFALFALLAFQLKHFIADFVLQTKFQVVNKGFYGRLGGIVHAGNHAVLSIPALLLLTRDPATIALVALAEFLVHYHIDWAKARTDRTMGWSSTTHIYWVVFGVDQLLHQLTYLAIVAILLARAAG